MSQHFDASQGLIIVGAQVTGPTSSAFLTLALDTGATRTVINTALLITLGCDPALSTDRIEVTTGSGVELATLVRVQSVAALGVSRNDFPVLAHTLPPTAKVDGLLGLDFLRETVLIIDFKTGLLRINA
jgi:predicted aspartyl protease